MSSKTKRTQQKNRSIQGQSLMEMALIAPFLLVLIIGALEVGRLAYTKVIINNLAREGAYYLSTHPSDYDSGTGTAPNTLTVVQADANNSGISNVTLSVTPRNCCTIGQYSVVVTVGTNVQDFLILGFLANNFSLSATKNQFPLSSSVEMMVQ